MIRVCEKAGKNHKNLHVSTPPAQTPFQLLLAVVAFICNALKFQSPAATSFRILRCSYVVAAQIMFFLDYLINVQTLGRNSNQRAEIYSRISKAGNVRFLLFSSVLKSAHLRVLCGHHNDVLLTFSRSRRHHCAKIFNGCDNVVRRAAAWVQHFGRLRRRFKQLAAVGVPNGKATRAQVLRGRYLVASLGCTDCHSNGANPSSAKWLAGYQSGAANSVFTLGPNTVNVANITPDATTGIGTWTATDIFNALRNGKDKEGKFLAPVMPWTAFRNLTDSDIYSIAAYLQNIHAVTNTGSRQHGSRRRRAGLDARLRFTARASRLSRRQREQCALKNFGATKIVSLLFSVKAEEVSSPLRPLCC